MTDRELLELAAKAAGLKIDKSPYNGGGSGNTGFDMMGNAVLDWYNNERWNPLTNDGDALRLAVKLSLWIGQHDDGVTVSDLYARINHEGVEENFNNDPYAATRRAIVRAAAEIGKEKNK
jgi:hypothetical protein